MSPIRIGIIGCGAVSKAHAEAYMRLGREACEVVAVADPNPENASKLAASFDRPPAAYADAAELLARADIDGVSICTPPALHRAQAIAAFEAGKHVLCEKPLAPSVAECEEMLLAAEKHGRKLAVAMQYRYRQDFLAIKHLVDAGALGAPVFALVNALYWRGDAYYRNHGTSWAKEGGGVVMTQAIHPIDVLTMMLGDVAEVAAELDTLAHDIEVEDTASIRLRFRRGAVANVFATTNAAAPGIGFTVAGASRAVSLPLKFDAVAPSEHGFPIAQPDDARRLEEAARNFLEAPSPIPMQADDGHDGPVADFVASIRDGREPWMSGRKARDTIELTAAIYKAGVTGERVALPLRADDPWRTTAGFLQGVQAYKGKGGKATP
ncbi:Gfo/Idh/MocA family oxidoreductase [Paenibacillus sp.]|uniref:Gfo/Idh/MocA family protein n=1 Tax=Paenibacillus sp. TaxID=58172 RepID=UPI002D28DD29|nr:Gfo/Idh/MocA family oxidoreductase [Paenibacillus sp.]HZG57043.1 Gfo/Idh/MocA family oxidoreductase [Paenibacillus sp.]